jgi:hypothetical protein
VITYPIAFVVLYETDTGNESFVEFNSWEDAYKWCETAIESGTHNCRILWVMKVDSYVVRHTRKMVEK